MKTLVRTNGNLFPAIPSLLNDLFTDDWFDSSLANWKSSGTTLPAVNVRETNDDFSIEVAAPGMKRDDFKVELDNNLLTISSQREDNREEKEKDGSYTRREFSYQSFQRSFRLPENKVEGDKIAARYVDVSCKSPFQRRKKLKLSLQNKYQFHKRKAGIPPF